MIEPKRPGKVHRKCVKCGRGFVRAAAEAARRPARYCSRACYDACRSKRPETETLARTIKRAWCRGVSLPELARQHERSLSWITQLFHMLPISDADRKRHRDGQKKATERVRRERSAAILPLVRAGVSRREIARRLGISVPLVQDAMRDASVPRGPTGRQLRRYCKNGHDLWLPDALYSPPGHPDRRACRQCIKARKSAKPGKESAHEPASGVPTVAQ